MNLLDQLPVWAVFIINVVLVLIAMEIGIRLGFSQRKTRPRGTEADAPIGATINVSLSLVAFILAFTFGVAAERYNARRLLVIDEANSIGTTFLRASFLPDENKVIVEKLLRQYVHERLVLLTELGEIKTLDKLPQALDKTDQIQTQLWQQATIVAKKYPTPISGLFCDSLNQTIDLQSARLAAGMYSRLPGVIWVVLYTTTFLGMLGLGYEFGRSGARNWTAISVVTISFAMTIMLIADLDIPTAGFLITNQQPLIDLAQKIGSPE